MKILKAIKNAFLRYKKEFDIALSSDRLFENFTKSLDSELENYEIVFDYICGSDSAKIEGFTKNYYLKKGDTIIMDISVKHENKWYDVTRTFFVNEVTSEQEKTFNLIKTAIKNGETALKDKARACDIYFALDSVLKTNGETLVHHAGHLISDTVVAQPQFLPEKTETVKSGDTVAIECGVYKDYGIRLENDYLVTDNGNVNLFEDLMPLNIKDYIL